jgi:hypothetical protein
MKTISRCIETTAVLIGGVVAYFYFIWKFGADVVLTTGSQVVDIWRR